MKLSLRLRWAIILGMLLGVVLLEVVVTYRRSSAIQQQLAGLVAAQYPAAEQQLLVGMVQRVRSEIAAAGDAAALGRSSEQLQSAAASLRLQSNNPAALQLAGELQVLAERLAAIAAQPATAEGISDDIARSEAALLAYEVDHAARKTMLSQLVERSGPNLFATIGGLLLLLAALLGGWYLLHRRLRQPLQNIVAALEAVRNGDFSRQLAGGIPADLAPLAQSYRAMAQTLRERQQALDTQLRRTALLTRLALELRETLEPNEVIDRVLRVVGANLSPDSATIIIATDSQNPAGYRWQPTTIRPLSSEQARRVAHQGVEAAALHGSNSTLISDVAASERWQAVAIPSERSGSAIVLPIQQNRRNLGSLTLFSRRLEAFNQTDLLLLESVAAQAGVAIGAAHRYQEERRRREQAIALLSLSQFLTGERSPIELAELIDRQSQAIFRADHGLLFLRPAGLSIRPLMVGPAPADMLPALLRQAGDAAERACNSGQIITAGTPQADTCVALPLVHAGKTLGACVLIRDASEENFSATLWSLLTIFVSAVASACANMQLIEQSRIYTERLEALVQQRTGELSRSRDLLRVVFDNLPEGLMLFDRSGHLLAANNAFCRSIVGRSPRDVVGILYRELWQDITQRSDLRLEPQGPEGQAAIALSPEQAAPDLRAASWRVLGTDFVGQQRWYAIERIPVAGSNGTIEQCLERWSDITHQEELQRRLLIHEQMTSLGRLAASVAHEVGNPLQSALGCLELCREDGSLSERATEYLELALGELDRMARTLESLRNLYRPPQITWESIDLNQIVEQVCRFTKRQIQSAGITLDLQIAAHMPLISGQSDALRQVLLNIVLNAVQAMPQGGTLRVQTRSKATDRMCELIVQDSGIGMPEEQLKHLFEPFRSAKAQGVGLGLFLSRQIIDQHSGHIDFESSPGVGTTVRIHLPWAGAQAATQAALTNTAKAEE